MGETRFPQTAPLILLDQNSDRVRRCSVQAPVGAEGEKLRGVEET
ncbi:hypothetical protein A2U01_0064387, partial [Trifolium medium]|nr:hypothetical protein [Trifolium medium]